jgi:hypothetical protein
MSPFTLCLFYPDPVHKDRIIYIDVESFHYIIRKTINAEANNNYQSISLRCIPAKRLTILVTCYFSFEFPRYEVKINTVFSNHLTVKFNY